MSDETLHGSELGAPAGPDSTRALARRAIFMLACMVPLAILSQFYRSANGVIAPNLMADLGLTAEDIGILTGSFFIVFTLLQIPVGVLLDRFGGRNIISAMMVLAVAGSLVFATADGLTGLTVARIMIGIGCAGIMVGSLVICSRWFLPVHYATAMSILFAFSNAGSLVAAGPLAAATSTWGWRGSYLGLAVLAAGFTLLFYLAVRDAPTDHPYHRRTPEKLMVAVVGLREVWSFRDVAYVLPLVSVGYATVITVLGLWGGPYLYDVYGLDEIARGKVLSILALAMIAGTLCYGPLDRRFNSRKALVTAGALATIAALVVLAALPNPSLVLASVLLALFCFFGAYSLVVMAHGLSLFPGRLVGRGVTTLNMGLMGGTAVIQVASGRLIGAVADQAGGSADLPYRWLFLALAVLTLVALAIYRRASFTKRMTGT